MSNYDDERPSWREIDRRRDRSRHVRQEKGERREKPYDRWKSGRIKEALDRLFKGEKGTLEHDKLYKKLHETYGTEKFLPTAKAYMEKYGPPDDLSTILLFLDLRDDSILMNTIEKAKNIYDSLSERERDDLKRKLKIISLTTKSKELKSILKDVFHL